MRSNISDVHDTCKYIVMTYTLPVESPVPSHLNGVETVVKLDVAGGVLLGASPPTDAATVEDKI